MDPNTYLNKNELIANLTSAKSIVDRAIQHVLDLQSQRPRSWERIFNTFFGTNAESFMKSLSLALDDDVSFCVSEWDRNNNKLVIEGGYGNPVGDTGHLDTCLNTLTHLAGFKKAFQNRTKDYLRESYTWFLTIPMDEQLSAEIDLWMLGEEETKVKREMRAISQKKKDAENVLSEIYKKKSNLRRKKNPVTAENPSPAKKTATG